MRSPLYREVEMARNSTVIAIASSHRRESTCDFIIPEDSGAALNLLLEGEDREGKLDLLIDLNLPPSGAALDLVYRLRKRFSQVSAIILGDAGGSGLLMALAADTIVVWEESNLIPLRKADVDIWMNTGRRMVSGHEPIGAEEIKSVLSELSSVSGRDGEIAIPDIISQIFQKGNAGDVAARISCETELKSLIRESLESSGRYSADENEKISTLFSRIRRINRIINVETASSSGLKVEQAETHLLPVLKDLRKSYADEFMEKKPVPLTNLDGPTTVRAHDGIENGQFRVRTAVIESTYSSALLMRRFEIESEKKENQTAFIRELRPMWLSADDSYEHFL